MWGKDTLRNEEGRNEIFPQAGISGWRIFVDLLEVMGFGGEGIFFLTAWQISNSLAEGKRGSFAGDRMENGSV
jgi:hypothetical protein